MTERCKKTRHVVASVATVAFWTSACLGIWLLSLSSVSDEELAIGAACALLVGLAAEAVRRIVGLPLSLRAIPVRALSALPFAIVSDAAQVLVRPLSRRRASAEVVRLELGTRGRSPSATTHRVATTLGVTMTPGTLVLDVDDATGQMTLHSLGTRGPHMEERLQHA